MQCLTATGDYLRALTRQDRGAALDVVLRAADGPLPLADVIEQMLVPAQVEVGARYQRDDWGIAEEHAATAITEVVLSVLAMRQPAPVPRPAPVCVTTPAGEGHGLAARMVAESLRARGWDAIFLGTDLPGDHLGRFLARVRPAALLLSCTTATVLPQLAGSLDVAAGAGVPTIVGGSACGPDESRARTAGANAWAPDIGTAHTLLTRWVDDGVAPPPARRARIPADYLELLDRRTALVGRFEAAAPGPADRPSARQVGAQLVDVLAAGVLVDDPRLFHDHVRWLVEMRQRRGTPPEVTRALLDVLRDALSDLPAAGRFTATAG